MVDLAPKVTGRVREVLVREGDRVKAGDVLVRLDLGETGLAVARDQSQVAAGRGPRARPRSRQPDDRDRRCRGRGARPQRRPSTLAEKELAAPAVPARAQGRRPQRDVDRATTDVERAKAALSASDEPARVAARRRAPLPGAAGAGRRRAGEERARSSRDRGSTKARSARPADAVVAPPLRRARPARDARPAGADAGVRRPALRPHLRARDGARPRAARASRPKSSSTPTRTARSRRKVAEISRDAEFTPKAVETRTERVNLVYAAKVDLDRRLERAARARPAGRGHRCRRRRPESARDHDVRA